MNPYAAIGTVVLERVAMPIFDKVILPTLKKGLEFLLNNWFYRKTKKIHRKVDKMAKKRRKKNGKGY